MARKLYIDTDSGRFVTGIDATYEAAFNGFEGDNVDYDLYFLTPSSGATAYEPLDYSSKSVKLHIGPQPPATATPYVVATAWTNLATTVGASVTRIATGGIATNEQQLLQFTPEAFAGSFSLTFPSQLLTISSVSAGLFTTSGSCGLVEGQQFVASGFGSPTGFSNGDSLFVAQLISATQFFANTTATSTAITSYVATAGAAYTITGVTTPLDARATPATVQSALEVLPSISVGNILVTGTKGQQHKITFSGPKSQVALPLMTVAASLTPVYGKTATLNFNTTELVNAISASASIDATMEVEVTDGSKIDTVAQATVTLTNDIIPVSGSVPVPASPATYFYLQSPDNTVFSVTVDNNGILTTTVV